MFDHRRTPYLAIGFALVIGTATIALIEMPARPLTLAQQGILYVLSYLPGLGFAMLSDPAAKRAKAKYLKIDFYAPKDGAEERGVGARPDLAVTGPAATSQGEGE